MYKVALIIVTFLLVVLANSPKAHAAEAGSIVTNHSKVSGNIITNPNKSDTEFSARSMSAPSAATATLTEVSVYDVWFDMEGDTDGDGYFHQFSINFDIDTAFSSQRIYVKGELHGTTSQPLFQTAPYDLSGDSGNDSYQAKVLLTEGYPSGQYALTLSIYDADSEQLLLQYDAQDRIHLGELYLESGDYESAALDSISVYELRFELSEDYDGDGYFTEIAVDLDADAPGQQRWVYARISLIDSFNQWTTINTSDAFRLDDYSANDRYYTRVDLDHGFDPDHYRLAVEIFDANSGNLLLTTTSPSNTLLKMESNDWDNDAYVVVEEEYYASASGGSTGIFLLLMLSLLLIVSRMKKSTK